MSERTVRRLPIVIVIVVAAIVAMVIGNTSPAPTRERIDAANASQVAPAGTRSSGWFCPGVPASVPLDAQTITIANIGGRPPTRRSPSIPTTAPLAVAQTVAIGPHSDTAPRARHARAGRRRGGRGVLTDVVVENGVESTNQFAVGPCASIASADWYFAAGTTGNFEAGTTGRPRRGLARAVQPVRHRRRVEVTLRTNEAVPEVLQKIDVPRRMRVLVPIHERAVRKPQVAVIRARDSSAGSSPRSRWCSAPNPVTPGSRLSLGAVKPAPSWTLAYGGSTTDTRTVVAIVNPGLLDTEADVIVSAAAAPLTVPLKRDAVVWVQIGGCGEPPAEAVSRCRRHLLYDDGRLRHRQADRGRAVRVLRQGCGRRGGGDAHGNTAAAAGSGLRARRGRAESQRRARHRQPRRGRGDRAACSSSARAPKSNRRRCTTSRSPPVSTRRTTSASLLGATDGALVVRASGPVVATRTLYSKGDITRSEAILDTR